jgi:hypothetical protein
MIKKSLFFLTLTLVAFLSIVRIGSKNGGAQSGTAEPEYSVDFEGGRAANFSYRDDGTIKFSIPEGPGGGEYLWFYFKVSNCGQEPLEFMIENAHGAHQTGRRWNITRPVFSADGRIWVRAQESSYGNAFGPASKLASKLGLISPPVFRFLSPIIADTLWVAYSYPYTESHLNSFLETIEDSEDVATTILGKSEEGRDIVMVHITGDHLPDKNRKQSIWIVGREHPGETPSSYICEGMIGALLGSASGSLLRDAFDFAIIPMLNVDGVEHGYYYHNARGVNIARDWLEPRSSEMRALRDGLIKDIRKRGIRLLINLHSANDPGKGHFFLVIPRDNLKYEDAEFEKRLLQAADKRHPELQGRSTVNLRGRIGSTGNASVLYHDFGLYSFYIESNYSLGADDSTVTQKSLREVGGALIEALAEVLVSE